MRDAFNFFLHKSKKSMQYVMRIMFSGTCKGVCFLLISGYFLCGVAVSFAQKAKIPELNYQIRRVVIDAGHGGKDPGASGRFSKEKDIALRIALKLGKVMEKRFSDVEVFYTRKDDTYVSLHERAAFANEKKADLFISIHCNWIRDRNISGTETYVMGIHRSRDNFEVAKRENSVILLEEDSLDVYQGFDPENLDSYILFTLYQNAYHQNSISFAQKVENQFESRIEKHSRGVRTAGFWVLWETSMPSVLIETGYLSNRKEERLLNSAKQQDRIALAIFQAFEDYRKEMEAE